MSELSNTGGGGGGKLFTDIKSGIWEGRKFYVLDVIIDTKY